MERTQGKNKFITNIPEYEGIGVYALVNNRNQRCILVLLKT